MDEIFNAELKAGEFAQRCGVKKDTLIHYEEINLLKPSFYKGNGYRIYRAHQLFRFDVITTLKKAKVPLNEIREFMENQSTDGFLEMLHRYQGLLEEEMERLRRMLNLMCRVDSTLQHAKDVPLEVLEVEDVPEEYVFASPIVIREHNPIELLYQFREHNLACLEKGVFDAYPVGEIVELMDLKGENEKKAYRPLYYCSLLPHRVDMPELFVKPAGTYVSWYCKGSYVTMIREKYNRFLHLVAKAGYRMVGFLYQFDQINYVEESDADQYIHKFSVRIERD